LTNLSVKALKGMSFNLLGKFTFSEAGYLTILAQASVFIQLSWRIVSLAYGLLLTL
jgi:hypothetical protein